MVGSDDYSLCRASSEGRYEIPTICGLFVAHRGSTSFNLPPLLFVLQGTKMQFQQTQFQQTAHCAHPVKAVRRCIDLTVLDLFQKALRD